VDFTVATYDQEQDYVELQFEALFNSSELSKEEQDGTAHGKFAASIADGAF
jgi:hypothetical protein